MKTFAAVAALGFAQATLAQDLFERISGGQNIRVETDVKEMMPLSTNLKKN